MPDVHHPGKLQIGSGNEGHSGNQGRAMGGLVDPGAIGPDIGLGRRAPQRNQRGRKNQYLSEAQQLLSLGSRSWGGFGRGSSVVFFSRFGGGHHFLNLGSQIFSGDFFRNCAQDFLALVAFDEVIF